MRVFAPLVFTGCLGLAMTAASVPAQHPSPQPRAIRLTATDSMRFSLPSFTARPGELLRVILTAVGTQPAAQMQHNFILLKPTADIATFVMMASLARDDGYMPSALEGEVLAATSLASSGQTVEVTFKAPAQTGSYPYLCSFPGHYNAGMMGTMFVKP